MTASRQHNSHPRQVYFRDDMGERDITEIPLQQTTVVLARSVVTGISRGVGVVVVS